MDTWLFYLINHGCANPFLDGFMPSFTNNWYYYTIPFIAVHAVRDWRKTLRVLLMAIIAAVLADAIGNQLKHLIGRVRPCRALADARMLAGCGKAFSMPSNHAATSFGSIALVWFLWRDRAAALMWAVAAAVAFSRVYVGVHYPGDVLVGGLLGVMTGYGVSRLSPYVEDREQRMPDAFVLGYALAIITIMRVLVVLWGPFDLSGDEAHYWDWSRRLDWSYYTKGPMIAWLIRAQTAIGGNSELAIRAGAMICSVVMSVFIFRLAMRMRINGKTALLAALLPHATPLFSVYGIVMSIDPPFIALWCVAMFQFHRAVSDDGRASDWTWLGLVIGLGLLTKFTMGLFFPAAIVFILASGDDRRWLKRKEPWIAAAVAIAVFIPVIVWNAGHDWATFRHNANHVVQNGDGVMAAMDEFGGFMLSQIGVISPVLLAMLLAASFSRKIERNGNRLFLFSFSIPILAFFALRSLFGKVQANWAMEAYPALFIMFAVYAGRWAGGSRSKAAWAAALVPAFALTLLVHSPFLMHKVTERAATMDKLIGWEELAKRSDEALASMPSPGSTFILSDSYMAASELAFYMKGNPTTYCAPGDRRMNQYDIWPGFFGFKGRDAIFVIMADDRMPRNIAAAFEKTGEPEQVKIEKYGAIMQEFTIFRCYGFKGMSPMEAESF